jgi:TonB family protein
VTIRPFARGAAAAAVLAALAGCAAAVQAPPAEAPDPAGCPEIVARARAEGVRTAPPVASTIFTPPDPPRALRGKAVVVRFRVGEDGRVDPASVRVEGSDDAAYDRRLAASIREYRFRPARLQGCRVAAETALRFEL